MSTVVAVGLYRWWEALPVHEVLRDHVVPVRLAALVPDVPDALVECHTRAIVDGLERDALVRVLGHVPDDVEGRQHRLLVVGLARQRNRRHLRLVRRWFRTVTSARSSTQQLSLRLKLKLVGTGVLGGVKQHHQ